MRDLTKYVDALFKNYPLTPQVKDAKEEILSNLEEKVADLTASGMNDKQAVARAVEDISGINIEVEGYIKVDFDRYPLELSQQNLINCLIVWILTIPFMIVAAGRYVSYSMLAAAILLGIYYFRLRAKSQGRPVPTVVNLRKINRTKKMIWILWTMLVVAQIVTVTAGQFGSNVWFGRPIILDGPYALALLVERYLLPFSTIVIPLHASASARLAKKHQIGEDHE